MTIPSDQPQTHAPSDADMARALAERGLHGALSTLTASGEPFGSVMPYVIEAGGDALMLASDLAEHTENFKNDARASLLIAEQFEPGAEGDPLALARVTLLGRVEPAGAEAKEPYLDRHPQAAMYAGFKDFSFYRLRVTSVRYVGGFGRMSWVKPLDFSIARSGQASPRPPLETSEKSASVT